MFSSLILLYIKRGMKNKFNLFLAPREVKKSTGSLIPDPKHCGTGTRYLPRKINLL
jgi:hypothetical protein